MEVFAVRNDTFFQEGIRDIIRFKQDFIKNDNNQPFDIAKVPILNGRIVNINIVDLELQHEVTFKLYNITSENMGIMKIYFKNA